MQRKIVFISYSWDNPEHQEWVLRLANDLIEKYGIQVILDRYELKMGSDLPYFMESSIEKADKVLMILTPGYKQRAENRENGVGYESVMISQELFESPITKSKFLPVLRAGDNTSSVPKFVKSKINHRMVDDDKYDFQLLELAKGIYDQEAINKPKLGPIPYFSSTSIDPLITKANSLQEEEKLNREIDSILHSYEGVQIGNSYWDNLSEILRAKILVYEDSTALRFTFESNYQDTIIIQTSGFSVSCSLLGRYSKSAHELKMKVKYFEGYISLKQFFHFPGEEPRLNKEELYFFDLNYLKSPVWKFKGEHLTTMDIAEKQFTYMLEKIQAEKKKKFRGK